MIQQTKIICTLGPASFDKSILKKLKKEKIDIFRINLSHTKKKDVLKTILYLKKNGIKNICIDTEGAQIRTVDIKKKRFLRSNQLVKICNLKHNKNNKIINLYPEFPINLLSYGSIIKIGFENLILKIVKKDLKKNFLLAKVISSGLLENNKGVYINKNITLPAISEKDKFAINTAVKNNIKFYALSFANRSSDIDEVRNLLKKDCFLISKIETKNGVNNLPEIARKSNALLIDRGDLSRYFEIEKIPPIQEKIIKIAKKYKTPVYVATNLLETMIQKSEPTRAESNDIFSTLKQGASGLVLAAETAIGSNPIACIQFLKKCINVFKNYSNSNK